MKDSIEYLATVVIALAAGFWLLNQLGQPLMEFVNQTAKMIAGGGF